MKKITKEAVSNWIPKRDPESYKGDYGRLLLIGSNEKMGGAVTMASLAALYSGAGLITTATAKENFNAIHAHAPEIMCVDMYHSEDLIEMIESVDTLLIGPGLGRDDQSEEVFKTVLNHVQENQVLVIDADAIYFYKKLGFPEIAAQTIFTPHPGEWETLSGLSPDEENLEDNAARQKELDAAIVLKKDRTQVYFGEEVWENTTGNPAMATGGTGDTLAGMIAGFSRQFASLKEATLAAVFIHSYIGDHLAEENYVVLPTKISQQIPQTMKSFEKKKESF